MRLMLALVSKAPRVSFSSCYREGGVRGHLQRFGVFLLRPVSEPHPEQQRRDHALLQDPAAQRPDAPHREVGGLRQPGAEERRGLAGHQPGLRGLRGPGGAREWEI